MSLTEREKLQKQADLCSRMGRFDEMLQITKQMAQKSSNSKPLNEEERNLLSVAYKNCVGARRTGWRHVLRIEKMEREDKNTRRIELSNAYRNAIENELTGICKDLLQVLDKKLITKSMDDEAAVFYYKMKGDYARYIAEVNVDTKTMVESYVNIAETAYKEALARAETGISDTHPLYLGLALNYSVFLHEMKQDHMTAIQVARKCYDQALDEIGSVEIVDESRYTECRNLLTLLHENLKIWTSSR